MKTTKEVRAFIRSLPLRAGSRSTIYTNKVKNPAERSVKIYCDALTDEQELALFKFADGNVVYTPGVDSGYGAWPAMNIRCAYVK